MDWKIDPAHSSVDFSVRYMVAEVHGRFTGMRGALTLSESQNGDMPDLLDFDAAFDATSLSTGAPQRDHHVSSKDLLDAATYPEGKVRLVSLTKDVAPEYLITVELSLHGVTRTVDVVATTAGPVVDSFGIPRFGATARGRIKRSDFGVKAYLGAISDDVEFTVNVQAVPASVPDEQLPPAN